MLETAPIASDTVSVVASRILGSVGRFLITSGIVVLLFVAYQLWGTGLQEAQAQDSLSGEFDDLLAALDDELPVATSSTTPSPSPTTRPAPTTTATGESTTSAPPRTTTTTVAPEPTSNTIKVTNPELLEALYRDGGEAIARLTIPSIGVRKVVVEGVKVEDLRNGPGHYRATVLPGQLGNSGIAGHRTTYGAPFNRIDELVPGDSINVRTVQGFHEYRVLPAGDAFSKAVADDTIDFTFAEGEEELGHIIVRPADTWVLGDFGDDRITLTACHPKYSAARRIIVAAELISEPVDSPPPPEEYRTGDVELATEAVDESEATGDPDSTEATDGGGDAIASRELSDGTGAPSRAVVVEDDFTLDEGLDGDESALLPAILWGLAAIATYTGFKQLARRWRFWPSIALGLVPVTLLMAASFEHIDRYLPAG